MNGIKFNILKVGFWSTIILAVLKLTYVINISNLFVFLPLLLAIGWIFFIIFLIGLFTLYLYVQEVKKMDAGGSESEEEA